MAATEGTAPSAASQAAPGAGGAQHETHPADAGSTEQQQSTSTAITSPSGPEHPLQTAWAFWYDKKLKKDEYNAIKAKNPSFKWKDNLKRIGTFDSVESFWRHYVYMKRPSALNCDMNLYCFRDGHEPLWENYPMGGVWILKLKKGSGVASKLWQDLLIGAIGEAFAEPTVVGVTLALRAKEDLLGVWNSDNTNAAVRFAIGEKLKSLLKLPAERTLIEYKFHVKSISDKSSYVNADAFVFTAGSGQNTPRGNAQRGARGRGNAQRKGGQGQQRQRRGQRGGAGSKTGGARRQGAPASA